MIIFAHGTFWREGSNPLEEPAERTPPVHVSHSDIPAAPWWTHKRLSCGFCTCVFGVEPGDTLRTDCLVYAFAAHEEGRPAQLRLSVNCPECRLLNRICESDADREPDDPFEPPTSGESGETDDKDDEDEDREPHEEDFFSLKDFMRDNP